MATIYSETHATVATGENLEVFRDTFLTHFWHYYKGASEKCHQKDFEIFPGGNGSVRLAVTPFGY